eukprot:gene23420-30696_t
MVIAHGWKLAGPACKLAAGLLSVAMLLLLLLILPLFWPWTGPKVLGLSSNSSIPFMGAPTTPTYSAIPAELDLSANSTDPHLASLSDLDLNFSTNLTDVSVGDAELETLTASTNLAVEPMELVDAGGIGPPSAPLAPDSHIALAGSTSEGALLNITSPSEAGPPSVPPAPDSVKPMDVSTSEGALPNATSSSGGMLTHQESGASAHSIGGQSKEKGASANSSRSGAKPTVVISPKKQFQEREASAHSSTRPAFKCGAMPTVITSPKEKTPMGTETKAVRTLRPFGSEANAKLPMPLNKVVLTEGQSGSGADSMQPMPFKKQQSMGIHKDEHANFPFNKYKSHSIASSGKGGNALPPWR